MTDISKIKPGDGAKLLATVEGVADANIILRLANGIGLYVTAADILEHIPAPRELQVGDRVTYGATGDEWEVVAPPRKRTDGRAEVAIWCDRLGYDFSPVAYLTLVESRND